MKRLKDILYKVHLVEVIGVTDIDVAQVEFDSRNVTSDTLFVATVGVAVDGHRFISGAISKGAIAIVCEVLPEKLEPGIVYIRVKDSHEALGQIASNFYDNPSNKLDLIGITGTNGKTTCATLSFDLFTALGYHCGLISTVVNRIGDREIKATHTTPNAVELNRLLAEMVEEGVAYCFMEVSSHAIVQRRIAGVRFKLAAFTNITHDHLDYHGTFKEYINAKKMLFDELPSDSYALFNNDDKNGKVMVQNTKGIIRSFAQKSVADFKVKVIENQLSGLVLNLNGQELWTSLIGSFNAYNIVTVFAIASLLEQDELEVLTAISKLSNVAGRFDYVQSELGVTGIVDYAHTPDALLNVLRTIDDIRTGNEEVITVVGCGGDRDKTKRPEMASIACKLSNKVILTSDNPRTEDPNQIIEDMKAGVDPVDYKKTLSIVDRAEAIRTACMFAKKGDIILIAGKGHENYQEINGIRSHFDDMEQLTTTFKNIGQ